MTWLSGVQITTSGGYLLNTRLCAETRLRQHAHGLRVAYPGLRVRQWGVTLGGTGVKDEAPDSGVEKATATCRYACTVPPNSLALI
ncbi:hypothetical protein PsYK624_168200 [Phanerochaete sordida]|uniref:Uncharacterized protein n=1 Tax=Phanerochaete sordida TaxID=48140 RepID=A0A9P3LP70_9APHY|nr:hypothetical protein PsYK624_168200 [Phanerochaete sordida]